MLYQELTQVIIKSCYEVVNELGRGFLESVYEKALVLALQQKGINAVSQAPITVMFRGQMVGQYYADIFVEEKVIVELKTVTQILPEHKAQVINYLKATGIKIGLLVNFALPKLEVYRLYNKNEVEENQ